jgi:hypothetical protein
MGEPAAVQSGVLTRLLYSVSLTMSFNQHFKLRYLLV